MGRTLNRSMITFMSSAEIAERKALKERRGLQLFPHGMSVARPMAMAMGNLEHMATINIAPVLRDFADIRAEQFAAIGRVGMALEIAAYGKDIAAILSREDFECARQFISYLDGAYELATASVRDDEPDCGTLDGYLSYQDLIHQ